ANETFLTGSTPNPFLGLASSVGTAANSTAAQILAHYPQFPVGDSASGWNGGGGIIEQNLNTGASFFNSLNVRLQKRFTHGLTATFNCIYSRLIEEVTWLNDSDPAPEKRVSSIDHPHRFVSYISYELPLGK